MSLAAVFEELSEWEQLSLEHRLSRMNEEERTAFEARIVRSAALELARRYHARAVRELYEREDLLADALQLVVEAIDDLEAANHLILDGAQATAEAA